MSATTPSNGATALANGDLALRWKRPSRMEILGGQRVRSNSQTCCLENVLRGSGDIGAMLSTAWCIRQIDAESNRIYVQNLKPREFEACEPFIIQGRPSIDETGCFEMPLPPGCAGELADHLDRKGGRPELPGKDEKEATARKLREQGMSYGDIAEKLGMKRTTVYKWLNPKSA